MLKMTEMVDFEKREDQRISFEYFSYFSIKSQAFFTVLVTIVNFYQYETNTNAENTQIHQRQDTNHMFLLIVRSSVQVSMTEQQKNVVIIAAVFSAKTFSK